MRPGRGRREREQPAPGDPRRGPAPGAGDRRPGQQGGGTHRRPRPRSGPTGVRPPRGRGRCGDRRRTPAGRGRGERQGRCARDRRWPGRSIGREIDDASHRELIDEAVAALRVRWRSRPRRTAGRRELTGPNRARRGDSERAPVRSGATRRRCWPTWPGTSCGEQMADDLERRWRTWCHAPTPWPWRSPTSPFPPPARRRCSRTCSPRGSTPSPCRSWCGPLIPGGWRSCPPCSTSSTSWPATMHDLAPPRVAGAGADREPHGVARLRGAGTPTPSSRSCAQTSELEEIEDELFRFARVVEASPALRSALSDIDRAAREPRSRSLHDLLDGQGPPGHPPTWSHDDAPGPRARPRGFARLAGRAGGPGPGLAGGPGVYRPAASTPTSSESWPRPWSASPADPWSCRSWLRPDASRRRRDPDRRSSRRCQRPAAVSNNWKSTSSSLRGRREEHTT